MRERPYYYRRDGKPIADSQTWAKLFEDQAYRRVAATILEDGTLISTVWIGLDHNFFEKGPPIIFETMVFSPEKHKSPISDMEFNEEWDCRRYATEAEAIMGHDAIVRKWKEARERYKKLGVQKSADEEPKRFEKN